MRGDHRVSAALLAAALTIHTPAFAQEGDDWDFGSDPARKLTIAAVTFDNFGVAVRCMDGTLGVVMSGLPEASDERRMGYWIGDHAAPQSPWVSGRRSNTAFAVWPRSVATALSRGGQLTVVAMDDQTPRRYTVDLPVSHAAIGQVFQACGHALEPVSDEDEAPSGETLGGLRWVKPPRPTFPSRSSDDGGLAALTCTLNAQGRLRDCAVESEFPEGAGFGRAATYAAHRTAEVAPTEPGGVMEGRRVSFTARYNLLPGAPLPAIATRLPQRDE